MNKATTILIGLALVSAAFAQRQGGGPGRMMMSGGGPGSEAMLLGRPDVQKDLKLTDEQKTKLEALRTEMQEKMQAFRGGPRGERAAESGVAQTPPPAGGAGVRIREGAAGGDMMAQFQTMQKEVGEKAKAILTEEQWTRLGQIKLQIAGPRSVMEDNELATKLGIKASQKIEINKLQEALNQANMQIFMKMRDAGADREALMKEIEKNNGILNAEIRKIFTADQNKAFDEMSGPKFEADPQYSMMRPFGGGPGGGGGRRGGGGG